MSDKFEGLVTINDHTTVNHEAPIGAKMDQLDSLKVIETLARVSSETETELTKLLTQFTSLREVESRIVHGIHEQIHSNKLAIQTQKLEAENARREHQLALLDRKIKAADTLVTKALTGLAAMQQSKQQMYSNASAAATPGQTKKGAKAV